jgi:cyanophycin synthetase
LREGSAKASHTTKSVEIFGEFLATNTAMDTLQNDDLCLILLDQVSEALAYIAHRVKLG